MTKRPAKASRSRRDQRQKYHWLDQIKADKKLPGSAFLVAFELKQGFNAKYGGACWKSIETLADDTGLSEPSIVRITRQLAQRGHLRIEPGKAGRGGRGHSNRYFRVEKTSADGAFSTGETSADGAFKGSEKGSAGESKGSAGGVDSIKTPLRGEAKASPRGERERSSHSLADPGALAPDGGAPEGLKARFDGLWSHWFSHRNFPDTDEDEARAWKAYVAIVPGEVSPGELDSRAEAHIAGLRANGLKVGDLWKWLVKDNWRKEPAPSPKPKRNAGKVSMADIAIDEGESS